TSYSASAETTASLKARYGQDLKVLGQIQSVDAMHGILIVAGQHVAISRNTLFTSETSAPQSAALAFATLQPGELVAVSGDLDGPATSIMRLQQAYVAGSTEIFVRGEVQAVDSSGRARVDGLSMDLTPAMGDSRFEQVHAKQVVEAVGTQPVPGGS